jgi:peptide/nickel transport system substrate-binding protein
MNWYEVINRRQLMLLPALLGLGVSTSMTELANAASTDQVRGKGTPIRGGVLTRALYNDPPSFDTMANTTGRVIAVVGPCCNGLLRYDALDPDKIILDLAESYEVSTDGLAYTFQLRKGVKFHDGRPMTSEDVKYTFDVMRNPPKGIVSVRANLFDAVDAIIVPTAHTVRFLLKRKSPSLISNLAGGWMVVLPKHILEKGPMEDVVVGTGPYKLKEDKRGVSIELVRNPDYHVPERPYLDGIKYFVIPDENSSFGYFRTGQIDEWAPSGAVAEGRQKEMEGRAYTLSGVSTSSNCLHFNAQEKPFDDIRVRLALCLAINRQESLDTVFGGGGVTAGLSMPGKWALPKAELQKIQGYGPFNSANIAKAKSLLAAAGFPNGFQETLLVQRIPIYEGHAIFIKDALLKIGVDLKLSFQESAEYNTTIRKRQWKLDAGGAPFHVNDPDAMYTDSVTCDGNLNYSKLCNPKIDALFSQQSQELDPRKRVALVNQMETLALAQYGSYKMYFRNISRMFQNNLHGLALHPNIDNATRFEDCWKSKKT